MTRRRGGKVIRTESTTTAVEALVTGKVQGVGFRKWAKSRAVELGLQGWVRNAGGGVEIRVQGPGEAVQSFLDACQRGPEKAQVAHVDHREVDTAAFSRFRIRKTVTVQRAKSASADEWPDDAPGPVGYEPSVVAQGFGSQKLSAYVISLECWRRGLTVTFRDPKAIQYSVTDGTRSISFYGSRSSLTTRQANRTVENKNLALNRLRKAGVPVPKSRLFHSSRTSGDDLVEVAQREYRWPVVIKPVEGSRGDGVFVNITSPQELRDLYEHLTTGLGAERILLEEHCEGDDYRIYVIGGRMVGAARRIPAHVSGDGSSTVRELVKAKNAQRKKNPFLSTGLIRRDMEIDNVLAEQHLDYDSIPTAGQYVQLRRKANASAGGDVEDVTDQLPQEIKDAAVAAVGSIPGLPAAGVDILWDKDSDAFVIIELNARAHIGVNMYPTKGRAPNIPAAIVDHFFPGSTPMQCAESLAFNLDSVLEPVRSGSAAQVQVAAAAPHGYPVRRVVKLSKRLELSAEQRRRLRLASRRYGVAGSLERDSRSSRLVFGGEEQPALDFLSKAGRILGQELPEPKEWHGTLMTGFFFSDTPLLNV